MALGVKAVAKGIAAKGRKQLQRTMTKKALSSKSSTESCVTPKRRLSGKRNPSTTTSPAPSQADSVVTDVVIDVKDDGCHAFVARAHTPVWEEEVADSGVMRQVR